MGFAYTPASHGGSQRTFSRDMGDLTGTFTWDEASGTLQCIDKP